MMLFIINKIWFWSFIPNSLFSKIMTTILYIWLILLFFFFKFILVASNSFIFIIVKLGVIFNRNSIWFIIFLKNFFNFIFYFIYLLLIIFFVFFIIFRFIIYFGITRFIWIIWIFWTFEIFSSDLFLFANLLIIFFLDLGYNCLWDSSILSGISESIFSLSLFNSLSKYALNSLNFYSNSLTQFLKISSELLLDSFANRLLG